MVILRLIHTVIYYLFLVVSTIIASSAAFLFGIFNPYSKFTTGAVRLWGKFLVWASFNKVIIEGRENFDPDKVYVFACNHSGALDIPLALLAIPQTARFVAKKELYRIPLLAQGMKFSGMLKVDRGNSEEARKTIDEAVQTVKQGCSVIIFPEGTRSKNGQIGTFKKGGFILALNGQIPIIPVVINGTQHVIPSNSQLMRRGTIKLKFLPPVDTTGADFEKRNELIKVVRESIVAEFDNDFNKMV